jgi:hypothetical protein
MIHRIAFLSGPRDSVMTRNATVLSTGLLQRQQIRLPTWALVGGWLSPPYRLLQRADQFEWILKVQRKRSQMATEFCQKCKQSHPGRLCDYDEEGECAETIDVQDGAERNSTSTTPLPESGGSSGGTKE